MSSESSGTPVGRRRRRRVRTVDLVGFDHVQLSMPRGEEALARLFYGGVLGLQEVRKPRQLARRGGAWFVGPGIAIHLGTEDPFRPARKAHVAFRVASLERARHRLEIHDVEIIEDDSGLPVQRCYIRDPFGNRIELVEEGDAGFSDRGPSPTPRKGGT